MGDVVLLDPELAPALAAAGVRSADDVLRLGGDPEARHRVTVIDLPVAGSVGRFHLKRYHYPGWGRSRHLIGRGTLLGTAPEVNEFRALAWLRAHKVPAVRPVAAVSRSRLGRLIAHALLTEHVPDALDLAARLDTPGDPVREDAHKRRAVLARVATELTRMHRARFVHRDCHARNILVGTSEEARVVFLDCRRGGPPGWRHGPLYDLATLDLDLDGRVPSSDRLRALRVWLGADEASTRTHAQIVRIRERLRRRRTRRKRPAR